MCCNKKTQLTHIMAQLTSCHVGLLFLYMAPLNGYFGKMVFHQGVCTECLDKINMILFGNYNRNIYLIEIKNGVTLWWLVCAISFFVFSLALCAAKRRKNATRKDEITKKCHAKKQQQKDE